MPTANQLACVVQLKLLQQIKKTEEEEEEVK